MTVEYRLFGILIWSVTRTLKVEDKEALFADFAQRLNRAIGRAAGTEA